MPTYIMSVSPLNTNIIFSMKTVTLSSLFHRWHTSSHAIQVHTHICKHTSKCLNVCHVWDGWTSVQKHTVNIPVDTRANVTCLHPVFDGIKSHTYLHSCARLPAHTHTYTPADLLAFEAQECSQHPPKAPKCHLEDF